MSNVIDGLSVFRGEKKQVRYEYVFDVPVSFKYWVAISVCLLLRKSVRITNVYLSNPFANEKDAVKTETSIVDRK
jgi:hypothetical protein